MAYNLSERFPPNPKSFPLLEPAGVYQRTNSILIRSNKVPFLSKTHRNTGTASTLWTHAIYCGDVSQRIPNCTSISSKIPRFSYELLSKENIEAVLCKCGIDTTCECCSEKEEKSENEKIICQGKIPRKIFKGITPRSIESKGPFSACGHDQNYKIFPDGSRIRALKQDDPPFYDTDVKEHSAFYHGWKWSKWTSQRINKLRETTPGPAAYKITTEPAYQTICAEKVRELKRKRSKQLRFIEMVQRKNILENFPGPANYQPTSPKGTNLNFLGPKAERFISSKYNEIPGPAKYNIKRDFEKGEEPLKYCHAKLPKPAAFGVKAVRFKYSSGDGPSPASYDSTCKRKFLNCTLAPFNSSTKRFKDEIEISDADSDSEFVANEAQESQSKNKLKDLPSWEFRSKTIRMKPLFKKLHEPSPADLPPLMNKKERRLQFQYSSPFFSSEPRFQTWFNWIPVHGAGNTPGPGYYNLESPKCLPAVHHGPISRSLRFKSNTFQTPAPNTYKIDNGIETILKTHNESLKDRIRNKNKFHWNPPAKTRLLGLKEKESALHFTKNTGVKHTATVIFFHGSGAAGDHMKEWVHLMAKNFTFPHIKILFPTAPLQPYIPAGGLMSNVWFDRVDINKRAPEVLESLRKIEVNVKELIKNENDAGIPSNRIIVGGFSMGGALALHTAYRWDPNVAGVFAFSSFLNDNSIVYKELKESPTNVSVPLLQIHGDYDDLVDMAWGQDTFKELKALGVQGEFHVMEQLGHSINKKGLNIIKDWIEKLLPDL
ncbi:unnamed protein product, partial [Brenthis ino]